MEIQAKIVFLKKNFEELKQGLQWDGKEKAAYILCHSSSYGNKVKLLPTKFFIPEKDDYVRRSAGYYELDKPFINKVLNEAVESQCDFVQCHVHPGDPGHFSIVDETEELKFMQHIADKIDGLYHGSLVFGNSLNTLDGWIYDRTKKKTAPIEKVVVVGNDGLEMLVPPRSNLKNLEIDPDLDRTVRAFGKEAVKMFALLDMGVVGVSALGTPCIEFIARDHYKSITLCDPDIIENTNLNRLPGTTTSDINKPKVEFYSEYIKRVCPDMEVSSFQKSFYDKDVQNAFSQVDILFGGVDSGARLSMNRMALANNIPYFDFGAGIGLVEGKPNFVGGQVYAVIPGREVCLSCAGVFNSLLSEYLSPEERKREIRQGYLMDNEEGMNPLVHFLDYAIAGIGYHQMLKYIWGYENDETFSVHFNGVGNKLVQSKCETGGCINCQPKGFLGKGEKVPILAPRRNVDNKRLEESIKRQLASCKLRAAL